MADLREAVEATIRDNGLRRDEQRAEARREREEAAKAAEERGDSPPYHGGPWSADLALREEGGFELWLGSLEDALSLEALRERGVNALLNCALESCLAEVACFQRPARGGRARSHTRGASLMDERSINLRGDDQPSLNRDQVWAVATFDEDWYSEALETQVAYHSMRAEDEADYEMEQHFSEIIDYVMECRRENRKVLVHCVMGVNRAPTATVAFLCGGLGMSIEAAVDQTSRSRGYILSNKSFIDQLIKRFGPGASEAAAAAAPAVGTGAEAAAPVPAASALKSPGGTASGQQRIEVSFAEAASDAVVEAR